MALFKQNLKEDKNTGFGNNAETIGNRLINKDGVTNSKKTGISIFERISWFHTLLKLPRWKFILSIFMAFFLANILFTILYYIVGIEHLKVIVPTSTFDEISKVFFFSVQTFTTVGYGHISPNNFATSAVSSIEAFTGLLFFALATGLLYGRFSKPNAYIKFSKNAIIAPYNEIKALMFRLVPYKNNHLTEAEVKLNIAMVEDVQGKKRTEFFTPKLEIEKINSLVLSWTIVHPIDEESPLYRLSYEDIVNKKIEVLVFVKAFDDTFSSTVIARTSYLYNEIKWGYKFTPMYQRSENQSSTIIEIDKLNAMQEMPIT